MRHYVSALLAVSLWLLPPSILGQGLGDSALTGAYHFVHLEIQASGAQVTSARSLAGTIVFDGDGRYSFDAERREGAAAPAPVQGMGSYSVGAQGGVTISHALQPGAFLNAMLSADQMVVLGATTERPSADRSYDILVALRAATGASNQSLQGDYAAASLEFPVSDRSSYRSAVASLVANGAGRFSAAEVSGHQRGGLNQTQAIAGARYALEANGAGMISFGDSASLLSGDRRLFVSPDGNYFLAHSRDRVSDLVVGVRKHQGARSGFSGRYWVAELLFDGFDFTAASGSMMPDGDALVLISERVRYEEAALDFSGLGFFAENGDSQGWLSNRVLEGVTNMALGVTEADGRAAAMVGAEVGAAGSASAEFGIFFLVRAPEFEGSGVFLHPAGIVNGASFAPLPNPVAPGSIVSLFGSGFMPPLGPGRLVAGQLPLPERLAGLMVKVDGQDAPLFFSSSGQVNFQIPFGLSGTGVTIQAQNGAAVSAPVTVPLAPTSPGVFSFIQPQSVYAAIATHADGTLVDLRNPALPGETVVVYATGLGELNPAVPAGAANPGLSGEAVARAADPRVVVLFNREPGQTLFAGGTPGFAGLYQINVTIPSNVIAGENVALAVVTANAFHDQVDLPVAGAAAAGKPLRSRARMPGVRIPARSRLPQ